MLGTDLVKFLSMEQKYEVVAPPRVALDVTREKLLRDYFNTVRPEIVINAVAYTNVDGAETERPLAAVLNADLPRLLAALCDESSARLVHFSTDQVFDGSKKSPWVESDAPAPVNEYGRTKWEGEKGALGSSNALVFRVQWLYGEKKDRFTPLKDKALFTPFADQVGCPTWTWDISRIVASAIEQDLRGLYHFAYDNYASWFDVFSFVCREQGYATQLLPKRTEEVNLPARRPLFSPLCNQKLKQVMSIDFGTWESRMREFLARQNRRSA